MYDDESDSDKPDENQIELVKKLHREMADRRIIVNMKNKIKNKKECVNLKSNKPKSVEIANQNIANCPYTTKISDILPKLVKTTKRVKKGFGKVTFSG